MVEGSQTACRVAYLGPPGTYGHQAATAFTSNFNGHVEFEPISDIPSVYTSPAEFLVMPLQNKIHGVVIETLDAILSSSFDVPRQALDKALGRPRIIGDLDLPIRHCLVVRKGVRMEDIRWIRSHEQALGQSSRFIRERLPLAKVQNWASTASAAVSLLDQTRQEGEGAAICSKAVVGLYPDQLEVLYEGTQGIDDNFTRFILLSRLERHQQYTNNLSRHPAPSSFFTVTSTEVLHRLLRYSVEISAIHSRPISLAEEEENMASLAHRSTLTKTAGGSGTRSQLEETYPLAYLVEIKQGPGAEEEPEKEGWCVGHTAVRVEAT